MLYGYVLGSSARFVRTGPLWAGPFWAPLGFVGPPGPLCAEPLWAGPLWGRPLWGRPLWAPLGPCGPGSYWQALVGHRRPLWARSLWAPRGPLWAEPLWAPMGPHGRGPNGPSRASPGHLMPHGEHWLPPVLTLAYLLNIHMSEVQKKGI